MLQVARLARLLLGDSTSLVVDFIRRHQLPDGGFADRAGCSDLYYTVFALQALEALQVDPPASELHAFLRSFGSGESLDFVHLTCLARCGAALPGVLQPSQRAAILERLDTHRSRDGGFHENPGAERGTAYAAYLALGAYQDLEAELPCPGRLRQVIPDLQAGDGGFGNYPGLAKGSTAATAAAVSVMRQLDAPVPPGIGNWLMARCYPGGGFFAGPDAPVPDLLSTATALHALAGLQIPLGGIRESCLDFIDTLWSSGGSFYGNWTDAELDSEYAFYGLLALGHLST